MSATEHVFEQHKALVAELRAGELEAPEGLRDRVLGAAPGLKRPRVPMSRRRRLVLLVPIAATLAVGAALIHGAFNSGPQALNAPTAIPGVLGLVARQHGRALAPLTRKAPTAAAGHAAQNYNGDTAAGGTAVYSESAPQKTEKATSGSGQLLAAGAFSQNLQGDNAVTIPSNRLVHADASLQVVVRSHAALTSATNKASQIVTKLGGYAQSVQYQASRSGDGNAYLDLRVPVGKVEAAIGKLGALGKLVSQQVATQDLQQQSSKQTNTIGSLKRAIAIYEQALSSGSLSGSQRVEVQIRLSNAEHSLTTERKAHAQTINSAATADVQLQLTTNQHAFVVGPHKSGRLGRLLGNAADFLGLEGIIVLYALIVAGPIALLLALGWAAMRERRRRDERRLLASA